MIVLLLCAMHALCDYPLQGDFLAKFKNRHVPSPTGETWWPHALVSHAFIHAGGVALVTGRADLALTELVLHTIIDFGKCDKWFGYHIDQALHLTCKLAYALIVLGVY